MREPLISLPICLALLGLLGCGQSDPVVARANGQDIKQSQLDAYIKLKQIEPKTPEAKANVLDDYVSRVALAGAIQSENDPANAVTEAEVDDFKKSTLIARYFKKLVDDKVTDQSIETYYREHSSEYTEQKLHVAQILVRADQSMPEAQRNAKLAVAQGALSQIQAGKSFAEVAAAVSEDTTTSKTGGDLGWLGTNNTYAQVLKRALTLKPQEVSEPVRSPAGFHIIKLLEAPQNVTKPLPTVKAEIRERLRNEIKTSETQRLLAKAKVEIDGKPRTESTQAAASDTRRAERK